MKILITGAAGFIGYNFCKYLLNKTNYEVYGIDNLNNYYDVKIKKNRLKILKKSKNFKFKKLDIRDNHPLEITFRKNKFDFVFNLAAQAGVRYSIKYPRKYIDSNIAGFFNIIENSKKYNVKRLFYASSSSVYGENNNFPLDEKEMINPKNIYALSKKINEEMAEIFSKQYNISFIGLRFFTVYGQWGRPDMFMMKYLTSSYNPTKKFYLNNFGNHTRDFTYIDDVCEIIKNLIYSKKNKVKHEIYNICSNRPVKLISVINDINVITNQNPKIFKRGLQKADVVKTHGSNKKVLSLIGKKKFTQLKKGLKNTIQWYKKYYNY